MIKGFSFESVAKPLRKKDPTHVSGCGGGVFMLWHCSLPGPGLQVRIPALLSVGVACMVSAVQTVSASFH